MRHTQKPALRHEVCAVCERIDDVFRTGDDLDVVDPCDPDRYKTCVGCAATVPYQIRRTKSYQSRWDECNAARCYDEMMRLRALLES
jgi:hypothetical protein